MDAQLAARQQAGASQTTRRASNSLMANRMQAALYNLSTLNDRVDKFKKLNRAWFAKHDQGYFQDPSVGWEARSWLDHRTRGVQWRNPASHIQDDVVLPNDAEL